MRTTLALVLIAGLATAAWAQPEKKADGPKAVPVQAAAPQGLQIPAELAKQGTVYHTVSGSERQVNFTSNAPGEKIVGNSNAVFGYAVAGPKDAPAALKGGEWHLPVTSMDTNNKMRNGHLASDAWLDAAKYPDVIFKLKEVKDIKDAGKEKGSSFSATLVGDMTIHGVTKAMTIPDATISFKAQTEKTAATVPGDLMMIAATYKVTLGDYGVKNKKIGQNVAENIEIKTELVLSTVEGAAPAKKG
jgi:polyisoprenoid-binding protein YceI